MEERRNNRTVERRLKDALRHDRARIQVGRISHFGLLEMSRQRLRTGVLEGSTTQCPHCQGTGIVRSVESVALAVLRALEDQLLRDARSSLTAVTTRRVALYILNNKRAFVTDMEQPLRRRPSRCRPATACRAPTSRSSGRPRPLRAAAAPSALPSTWSGASTARKATRTGRGAEEAAARGTATAAAPRGAGAGVAGATTRRRPASLERAQHRNGKQRSPRRMPTKRRRQAYAADEQPRARAARPAEALASQPARQQRPVDVRDGRRPGRRRGADAGAAARRDG